MAKKTCRVCKEKFTPSRPLQPVCENYSCKVEYALQAASKSAAKRAKESRNKDKVAREKLKTRSDWLKSAQVAFNAYIRYRDKDERCICCGEPLMLINVGLRGGSYDCGHYRSVGSAPHLRFDERNAHAQRKQCNSYRSGRHVEYRKGLIAKIGLKAVEELEADQSVKKWTIDDLKEIVRLYRSKLRQAKKSAPDISTGP